MEKVIVSIALSALCALPASAQTGSAAGTLVVEGSVRVRGEWLNGQARAGLPSEDDLVAIRTLVAAEYRTPRWRIGIELQDSRVYGEDPGSATSANDVNVLEPVQAYVGVTLLDRPDRQQRIQATIGRQTLNLGSRRLIAADDYRNTTNAYTGIRIDAQLSRRIRATVTATAPQLRLPDDAEAVRANEFELDRERLSTRLWGGLLWFEEDGAVPLIELAAHRFVEEDTPARPTRDRRLTTMGLRLLRMPAPGRADFELEAMRQTGSTATSLSAAAPQVPVSAWFAHADVGFSLVRPAGSRISVEFDYASGDGRSRRFTRFDTLFGMRRADFAPAGIYAQIGRTNIVTPAVRWEWTPSRRFDAFLAARAMWLAGRSDSFSTTGIRDIDPAASRFAGHQIEGRARWWVVPQRLRIEANAAWLDKGRFLREAPNAPPGRTVAYASVSATWSFRSGS